MKKVFFSAIALMLATSLNSVAATPVSEIRIENEEAAQERTQVDPAALPDAIKTALSAEAYNEWKVQSAWLIKGETNHYELNLQKGEEAMTVKLDENGNVVK